MTTLAAPPGNELSTTIATGHSYIRGTTTDIYLTAHAACPNSAHVVRIRNADNTKWALVIYSTKTVGSPGYITMSAADDYALAKNVTTGDEAYEWPAGSIVELICAADEIAQLFSEDETWTKNHDAAGYTLFDIGAATYFKYVGLDNVVRGWKPRAGQCTRANIDIYVRTDGDDSNDGSANDAGHALLTIQKAIDLIPDLSAHMVHLHIADGTYNETVTIMNKHGVTSAASLTITGNTTTPANVKIDGASTRAECLRIENCVLPITVEGIQCEDATAGNIYFLNLNDITINDLNSISADGGNGLTTINCIITLGNNVHLNSNAGSGLSMLHSYISNSSITGFEAKSNTQRGIYAEYNYLLLSGADSTNRDEIDLSNNTMSGLHLWRHCNSYIRYATIGGNGGDGVRARSMCALYLRQSKNGTGGANTDHGINAVEKSFVKELDCTDDLDTDQSADATSDIV